MENAVTVSKRVFQILSVALVIVSFLCPGLGRAQETEDTMLMFVGEELDVLSIASRREESARQAPAVANVITREMMETRGMYTVSQALSQMPGFYMAKKEWGSRPYLRGIPDSVLFLYDTVPMQSDLSKSVHPLDEELSLAPVKRIEIVRGPGSVLWGADAFAGIVNIVPMTGKDLNGVETGIAYGDPGDFKEYHINAGHDGGAWDGFISLIGREGAADERTANVVRFWGDQNGTPVPPDERYGYERAERPHFIEVVGNLNVRDWLTLSGRYSDYTVPYSMADRDRDRVWLEERGNPVSYVKLEGKKDVGLNSAVRFTGYYAAVDSTHEVIDLAFEPSEYTTYGELIYDHDFWTGKGLLTAGAAWRNRRVSDAPIWDSYLPDFLGPDNTTFLPTIIHEDYDTRLWSFFGQYSHKIGRVDISAGLRHDDHDAYKDSLSYNFSMVWSPTAAWTMKALYGTGYRTPFASQLMDAEEPDLEGINTANLEISWQPDQRWGLTLGGFVNHISDHIMEDPYAGLSVSNHQKIYGAELEGRIQPMDSLELAANLTVMNNSGPDETYLYNDYTFLRPDGTLEKHYVEINYPFDTGPDTLLNLTAEWAPMDRFSLFCRASYVSSQDVICATCDTRDRVSGVWLADAAATVRDILVPGLDMHLQLKNIADKNYQTPGTNSTIDGDPFSLRLILVKKW